MSSASRPDTSAQARPEASERSGGRCRSLTYLPHPRQLNSRLSVPLLHYHNTLFTSSSALSLLTWKASLLLEASPPALPFTMLLRKRPPISRNYDLEIPDSDDAESSYSDNHSEADATDADE